MSEPPPETRPTASSEFVPGDADDTRGRHFAAMIRSPAALAGIAATGIVFALIALVLAPPGAWWVLALLGGIAAGVLVVFRRASGRAADDFFRAYSRARSLRWSDVEGRIAPATPLLRKGDERRTDLELSGRWPSGFEGLLAHYTYVEVSRDSKGRRQESEYRFTVTLSDVPSVAPFLGELYVQRRSGFRFLDAAEDLFRTRRRVEHESEELDRDFEIFIGEHDEMNRALQVLSPTFIIWLHDHTPESFGFECCGGTLVCAVKGHAGSAAELDRLTETAAAVAERLIEEAAE